MNKPNLDVTGWKIKIWCWCTRNSGPWRVKLNYALFPLTCGPSQGQWQHTPQASSKSASSSYSRCARMPQSPCYDHILPDREWILQKCLFLPKLPQNTQKRPGWGMTQGARKGSDWALRLWMSMIFKTVGPHRALLQPGFEDDLHVNSPKSTTTGGTHPCQVKPLAQFQDMCIILQKRSTPSVNSKHGQWMEIPSFGCSQESAVFFFSQRLPKYQNLLKKSSTKNKTSKHQHDTLDTMVIHGPWLGPTYWSFIPGSALGLSISSAVSKPMARRLSPV